MEDTGNLVLRNANNSVVWQSFDTPTDTLLPTQRLLENSSTAILTAWEDVSDWRDGNYSLRWSNASNLSLSYAIPYGRWYSPNNYWVTSVSYWPTTAFTSPFTYAVLQTNGDFRGINDVPGSYSNISIGAADGGGTGKLYRLTLDIDGDLRMYSWSNGSPNWTIEWKAIDECSVKGYCGPYGICATGGSCSCPDQFVWVDSADKRLGCQRIYPAEYCGVQNEYNDTFLPPQSNDWPSNDISYTANVNVSTCQQLCLANCSCQGIVVNLPLDANNITTYCFLKGFPLLNGAIQGGKASYLRVGGTASSSIPPGPTLPSPHARKVNTLTIVASTLGALVALLAALSFVLGCFFLALRRQKSRQERLEAKWVGSKGVMVRFTYPEIVLMTAKFGTRIGEGGFGTVFKGHIGRNVTVAVKRLNKQLSTDVEREFLNEVKSIGLIHHVNLVSLLGYCAEGNHRLLVYEYVDRGSLDRALYRKEKSHPVLEWRPRFAIAIQTARGLAYLHDDCNEQIIHCDVKPENILLDSDLNAKVADFGISRIMKRGQAWTETINIRGTKGYIGPEWMSDRLGITSKVDVYSYGMVLLEIISGRRNLASDRVDASGMYFPTWAYPKIETEAFMEVLDPALTGIVDADEVRRALRVAFWCINWSPEARPRMGEVVQMLQGHVAIPVPVPRPEFFDIMEYNREVDEYGVSSELSALHLSSSGASARPIDEARAGSLQLRPTTSWSEHSY